MFLMGLADYFYWQGGYCELEVKTQNGLALITRDDEPSDYVIRTWVPEAHLRPEQAQGWSEAWSPNVRSYLLAAGKRPLPRISTAVHREGLQE